MGGGGFDYNAIPLDPHIVASIYNSTIKTAIISFLCDPGHFGLKCKILLEYNPSVDKNIGECIHRPTKVKTKWSQLSV